MLNKIYDKICIKEWVLGHYEGRMIVLYLILGVVKKIGLGTHPNDPWFLCIGISGLNSAIDYGLFEEIRSLFDLRHVIFSTKSLKRFIALWVLEQLISLWLSKDYPHEIIIAFLKDLQ